MQGKWGKGKRFRLALSLAGEERGFIGEAAEILLSGLGRKPFSTTSIIMINLQSELQLFAPASCMTIMLSASGTGLVQPAESERIRSDAAGNKTPRRTSDSCSTAKRLLGSKLLAGRTPRTTTPHTAQWLVYAQPLANF